MDIQGVEGVANVPEWVEGLKWIIATFLLAAAYVGPKVLAPLLMKWKAAMPPPPPQLGASMAVVGGALADRESIVALVAAINRLSEILEQRFQIEKAESDDDKMRKHMKELVADLVRAETTKK